jgi:hypothetical protein
MVNPEVRGERLMATRSIRYIKRGQQMPLPPVTVSASAYVDRWTNRKAAVRSFIYIEQAGNEGSLTLTPAEAERLLVALNSALEDIPAMELDAQQRDLAAPAVSEVEED